MKLTDTTVLAEKAEFVLQKAAAAGAEQCIINIQEGIGHNVQYRHGELEELTREQEINISLTVYRGTQKGSVDLSDWREEVLENAVQAALQSSIFTDPDPAAGIAEKEYLADIDSAAIRALDLYHTPADIDTLKDFAARAEAAAFATDPRICNSEGSSAYAGISQVFLANSNGFANGYNSSYVGFNVSVLGKDGDNQQSNYAYDSRHALSDLKTPEEIGKEAAEKTVAALNPRPIKAGEYPVLYRPNMAAGLIGHLLGALGGVAQYRKLSFLTDSLGKIILPEWLSLIEQPNLCRGGNSAPFDHEGISVRQPEIVNNGKILRYLLSSYSARRLGMQPTGNADGVHNLQLVADAEHLLVEKELLQEMGQGVVITSLMGQGVNSLTGDYSRGASGFWVENGEIAYPIEGITVAGNLKDFLKNIVALGTDADTHGGVHAPSILFEKMTIAQ